MLKNLEIDFNYHLKIKRYCKKKKLFFQSSRMESLDYRGNSCLFQVAKIKKGTCNSD